jgi:ubiquitin-protein ligase
MNMKRLLRDIEVGRTNLAKLGFHIQPDESNLKDIHFLMPGPADTPYAGGLYHGLLRLSDQHPMKPVTLHMFTPSGRFVVARQPVAKHDSGICTTNTVYHESSWTPLNTIENILIGFQSFMAEDSCHVGSMKASTTERVRLAMASHSCLRAHPVVCKMFPFVLDGFVIPESLSS